MNIQTKTQIELAVQSFAYVAGQIAKSPCAQYDQISSEAEKHRQALRVLLRDVFEMTREKLRSQAITQRGCQRMRKAATYSIGQAEAAITRIAAQYEPQKLAA